MSKAIHSIVPSEHEDYLRDESRRPGTAHSISFPACEDDVRQILRRVCGGGISVTTQGARTGITGGAVPQGGHILNLSRMNRIVGLRHDAGRDLFLISVQPGVVLSELRKNLESKSFETVGWSQESESALVAFRASGGFFFPPDPTETSACVGGMVACNASGACSFHYGATRRYVQGLTVILPDGDSLHLQRGRERALGRRFAIKSESGRDISGRLPDYVMPGVKNAAGYYASDDMDVIDLFVGCEGTLGVITEIELVLLPVPECRWGIAAFFPAQESAIRFVKTVREASGSRRPVAVEFFDRHSLDLLRRQKASHSAFAAIPDMSPRHNTAIYVEYHGAESEVAEAVETMSEAIRSAGGDADDTWIATTDVELERLKFFRHAVPESVNMHISELKKSDPEIAKLGTDMAVPDSCLDAALAMYEKGLADACLDFVMFGHIGNNHFHVNILPRNAREYTVGKDLYLQWARQVVAWGGTVSAEHGIGKFKIALLREMYGDAGIHQMRDLKRVFDPAGRLNPGNLF